MTSRQDYAKPHDRKCELCERIFIATKQDQRNAEYRCNACRAKEFLAEDAGFRPPERGEFNPQPGRRY